MQDRLQRSDIFLVGGCVRDILLGVNMEPNDLDVTLSWQPKAIANVIEKSDISFFMTEKYGTMTVIPKEDNESWDEQIQYEITPFRTESDYTDSRHPDQVNWTDNLVLDSKRRDFTINAMYYTFIAWDKKKAKKKSDKTIYEPTVIFTHLSKEWIFVAEHIHTVILTEHTLIEKLFPTGKFDEAFFDKYMTKQFPDLDLKSFKAAWISFVLDPYQGMVDMIQRKIKAVWSPEQRFEEDALRVIRAIRFVNVLNDKLDELSKKDWVETSSDLAYFDIDKTTWKSLKKNYYRVQRVAKERIKIELDKVFKRSNPSGFVGLLDELNILKYLFPAVYATKGVDQPIRYHPFDVYTHSRLCLHEFQKINNDRLGQYAMLYHDVGKTDQYYSYYMWLDQDEVRSIFGTWLNHINSGADMARADFWALGFSKKEIDTIAWYIANHMKPGEILMAKRDNRKKKLRKLLSDGWEEKVRVLLDITIADRLWQYNPVQPPAILDVKELIDLLDELLAEEGQFTMKELNLSGDDLMKKFKLKPWPQLGELIKKAFNWVMEDITNRNNSDTILEYLKEHI